MLNKKNCEFCAKNGTIVEDQKNLLNTVKDLSKVAINGRQNIQAAVLSRNYGCTKACRTSHLSRGTFYYWKPRFEKEGYAGLETTGSHAPHHPAQTASEVVAQIVALKEAHPEWGKQRIADELMKSNGWVPLVSAGTVYNILVAKGLIDSRYSRRKKKRTASAAVV